MDRSARDRHGVTPAQAWTQALSAWGIPQAILDQAPESPWIHPVTQFTVDPTARERTTPAERVALDAMPVGGSVLDVGCGGGKAAFALTPPAAHVIGVDHQAGMLEEFAAVAGTLDVGHDEVLGDWPEAADRTPTADVVTCHHVLYNVGDLPPFITALDAHATHRVVIEIPWQHPLVGMAPAWRHFWQLERPEGPTAEDALAVIRALGLHASLERFSAPYDGPELPFDEQVRHLRIRLCLPAERDDDVAAFLAAHPPKQIRDLAVIWWDTNRNGAR